jgi:phenylalanyl-tRNA synthetase alpha chain
MIMQESIDKIVDEINGFIPKSKIELEELRIKLLSKKGSVSVLFDEFKTVNPELKRALGKPLNELKSLVQEKLEYWAELLEQSASSDVGSDEDLTKPSEPFNVGSRHPISLVRNHIVDIFSRIGFVVNDGPEIEDDWHNFSALNFPEEHPARDMQDTFFIDKEVALRTHTSSVQVRIMETQKPPIRILMPGRVYRNEAISARAHCQFHQVEGLYIDENVSFADLKQTLLYFAKEMFGEGTEIRLRPSYFPFTEPSAEVDITCHICSGKGCNICKHSGWVEILGCGMVDPNVLENCGIDSNKYAGFAFGMGIERITMLKYKVNDLRHFFENDVRFLEQFSGNL